MHSFFLQDKRRWYAKKKEEQREYPSTAEETLARGLNAHGIIAEVRSSKDNICANVRTTGPTGGVLVFICDAGDGVCSMARRDGVVVHKKLGQEALDMVHTIVETGHKLLSQQEDEPQPLEEVAYNIQ